MSVDELLLERANRGELFVHQLAELRHGDESCITPQIVAGAYAYEIRTRIFQAVEGFKHKSYATSIEGLESCELRITEALQQKLPGVTIEDYLVAVDQIGALVKDDFCGSRALYGFLKTSKVVPAHAIDAYRASLQDHALIYCQNAMKKTRRAAKGLRRELGTSQSRIRKVQRHLEYLESLSEFGLDVSQRVEDIRTIAYQRGVGLLLKKAAYVLDEREAAALRKKARYNATVLGRQLSSH